MKKEIKWKNDNGTYRTADLFYETQTQKNNDPVYTLNNNDREVNGLFLPSLKKLYIEEEDIAEFDFANKYLDGYTHWEALINSKALFPHIEQWRKEMVLKIKSRSLKGIIRDAVRENKYEANKFLITNGWVDKDSEGKKVRGRPSKEEIKNELQKQAETEKELQEDLNRIKELN